MRRFTCKSIFALAVFGLLGMMASLIWLGDTTVVEAQSSETLIIEGKVLIDDRPAPDGTQVTAYIDGHDVADAKTNGGTFILGVPEQPGQPLIGKVIEFAAMLADGRQFDFPQTAIWYPAGRANIRLQASIGFSVDNEPHPPWVVQGEVMIGGRPAPDRTQINAHVDGALIAGTRTSGNAFVLAIPEPPGRSLSGATIEFNATTPNGRGFRALRTFTWRPGVESTISLQFPGGPEPIPNQPFSPFPFNVPIPQVPEGLDIGCVMKILGRIPSGPQDMSRSEQLRVAQNCFNGGGSDGEASLEQEKQFLEQERAFQQ